MDKTHYEEMVRNLNALEKEALLKDKALYLFGHCNATETLIDLLLERKYRVCGILDNNVLKYETSYRNTPVLPPNTILESNTEHTIVFIAARAYSSMAKQLRMLGFAGRIEKLVDYNSYAEYSLSEETIRRKGQRIERGFALKQKLERKYPEHFKILCPFSALGDVFFAMSYLPHFLKKRSIERYVVCVIGNACAEVVSLFDGVLAEKYDQKDMDELVQACLYTQDSHFFIAHQDRPYVVNLHKALYVKCIPLEKIYCCGVFGLLEDTRPIMPTGMKAYPKLCDINKGGAVVFSPYAKSVTTLSKDFWDKVVQDYKRKGYQCLTNVAGDEQPLDGTEAISPQISELQSVAEYAGTFIGIRSGLCDILKYARCEKTALYPDYNYCDTKWKAIDMYAIEGWNNLVVGDEYLERLRTGDTVCIHPDGETLQNIRE